LKTSKSALDALPERTRECFLRLRAIPAVEEYLMVGGTALALRLQHRLSEDIDFLTVGKLRRKAIETVIRDLGKKSRVRKISSPVDEQDFRDSGLDLDDHQQNYEVDGVRLSFFAQTTGNPELTRALADVLKPEPVPRLESGHIRIASLESIFTLKSILLAERVMSRDLYDLYTFINRGAYSLGDILDCCSRFGADAETVKIRMLRSRRAPHDPGVDPTDGSVVTFESLQAWFREQINEFERAQAQRSAENRKSPNL
jgi:hypothetical protein